MEKKSSYNRIELEALANQHKKKCPYFVFDRSEIYSFGRIIKTMGFYPRFLPLCVVTDHSGPNFNPLPYDYELDSQGHDFLTHSKHKADAFAQKTGNKGFVIKNPFEWYYKKKATYFDLLSAEFYTFFPVHHLPSDREERFDIDKTLSSVLSLIDDISKLRVCLHKHDIDKGLHLKYLDAGYQVITAGNSLDDRFVDRFLHILFSSKVILANHIGSIGFYSHLFRRNFIYISDEYQNWGSLVEQRIAKELAKDDGYRNTKLVNSLFRVIYDSDLAINRWNLTLVLYRNLLKRIF